MDLLHQPDLFSQPAFFDTIQLSGEDKHKAEVSARKGNVAVLLIFKENPNLNFTPRQIHLMLIARGFNYELTSVRRAITSLTDAEILIKNGKEFQ